MKLFKLAWTFFVLFLLFFYPFAFLTLVGIVVGVKILRSVFVV